MEIALPFLWKHKSSDLLGVHFSVWKNRVYLLGLFHWSKTSSSKSEQNAKQHLCVRIFRIFTKKVYFNG